MAFAIHSLSASSALLDGDVAVRRHLQSFFLLSPALPTWAACATGATGFAPRLDASRPGHLRSSRDILVAVDGLDALDASLL